MAAKYPQGAEKMLIKVLLGREIPSRGLPADIGVSVFNVATLAQIGELLPRRQGLIERVLTVSGPGVTKPGNYLVALGTPVRWVLEQAGCVGEAASVILGGPMMGASIASLDVPVTKGVTGILVLTNRGVECADLSLHSLRLVRQYLPDAIESVAARHAGAEGALRGNGRRIPSERLLRVWVLQLCVSFAHTAGAIFPRRQTDESERKGACMSAFSSAVIEVRTSPHLHSGHSVNTIMRNVVYALLPICAYSVWLFGIGALASIATSTAACVLTEHVVCRLSGKRSSVGDFSVVITGLLLGLVLPPGFPLWMAAVGGFIAVGPGKMLFGGLGFNAFNPALVGRAFLQAAFPVAITSYTPALAMHRFTEWIPSSLAWPLMKAPPLAGWIAKVRVDAFTGATPLMLQKFDHIPTDPWMLFWGGRAGSAGESSALLILICGGYLAARKMMDWRIPAAMLSSAFLFGSLFHLANPALYPGPWFVLFSGGLMLGAVFMATDPVASPVTPLGMCIYGALMGLITVLIRFLGGLAEGVMYAILLGNALSPLIDKFTQPRPYGAPKKSRATA